MAKTDHRRTLDPVQTRGAIMEAALASFAESGYHGASIGGIAEAAGVPKSLVQYHFGSKEDLWQACIAHRAAHVIEAFDRFLESGSTDIVPLIEARFEFLRANPEVRRLLAWMNLEQIPLPSFIAERRERVVTRLGGLQSPQMMRLMFAMSAMDGWFLHQKMFKGLRSENTQNAESEDRFLQMLIGMVREA